MAQIIWFGGSFAPKYWAYCNGQLLAINTNQALFSLLGTTFGGNGQTTFALPDLRSRVPVGMGNGKGLSPRTQGETGGTETVTLNLGTMPMHTHGLHVKVGVANSPGGSDEANGNTLAAGNPNYQTPNAANAALGGTSVTVQPVGTASPVSLLQPYLAISPIICVSGLYPSRS